MKKMKLGSLITGLAGLAALLVIASSPAQAAFVVGGEQGWQMSFDGMINAFMVYDAIGNRQLSNGTTQPNAPGTMLFNNGPNADQGFEVRTGLLPSIFAFNVKSPTINGVDYGARIGLYPEIQNNGSRTSFGPDTLASNSLGGVGHGFGGGSRIDIREVFFTADACWGQVLGGRALNLYEGKNILTDMTLLGVGVPIDMHGAGTTLGHIGYGYSFPSFGSQFRYTTPDYKGFKWAFSVNEPSKISSAGGFVEATKMNQPAFNTEFSYATAYPNGKMQAWASGLYQEAKITSLATDGTAVHLNGKVASIGGAGGIEASYGPLDGMVSGYGGQAIGLTFTQDDILSGSLDNAGKERTSYGGLFQLMYTIGKAKLGANYGINYQDRTNFDKTQSPTNIVKSQQAVTGGIYYSVNKYMLLVGEYTWARTSWYDSGRQDQNIGAIGTVFTW